MEAMLRNNKAQYFVDQNLKKVELKEKLVQEMNVKENWPYTGSLSTFYFIDHNNTLRELRFTDEELEKFMLSNFKIVVKKRYYPKSSEDNKFQFVFDTVPQI